MQEREREREREREFCVNRKIAANRIVVVATIVTEL